MKMEAEFGADVATSQKMLIHIRCQKRQGREPSLEPLEGAQPCPQNRGRINMCCCNHGNLHGSHRKLT